MQSLQKFFIILVFITTPFLTKADAILGQFMPYYFYDDLTYIETTQDQLLSTTNAEKVFSFDYVLEDDIFASVYATQTNRETYDRHINVFRRSEGYNLIDIEAINVEEYTFLLSKYMDKENKISYVLAFSMEFLNGDLDLHSHWSPNQITTVHKLYNYEIIFSNRNDVLFFLPLMVDKIKDIIDLNPVTENLICPKLFVSEYAYVNDELVFTMYNDLGNKWIQLSGENLDLDVEIGDDLNCEISFPWDAQRGTIIEVNNAIDFQEDLIFIEANMITTGTSDLGRTDLNFEIFPNPTMEFINVKAKGHIQLVDMMGKLIYSFSDVQGEIRIDVSNLPKKQYFLIHTHNSRIETKEVIVI